MVSKTRNSFEGFTLIELMIVVAILGSLAAIAIPKFADLVNKTREAQTKGNLGAIRSALQIYYADNEGRFPVHVESDSPPFFSSTLSKYLTGSRFIPVYPNTACNENVSAGYGMVIIGDSSFACDNPSGGWLYDGVRTNIRWGDFGPRCCEADSKGNAWNAY